MLPWWTWRVKRSIIIPELRSWTSRFFAPIVRLLWSILGVGPHGIWLRLFVVLDAGVARRELLSSVYLFAWWHPPKQGLPQGLRFLFYWTIIIICVMHMVVILQFLWELQHDTPFYFWTFISLSFFHGRDFMIPLRVKIDNCEFYICVIA